VPDAYTVLRAGAVRAAVRRDLEPLLGGWLLAPTLVLPADAERIASGRGAAFRATLRGGLRAVIRLNRRGGPVASLVRETYVGLRQRPFRELALTAEVRRRGVPAPEVLAVRVEGRLLYRGALVTAEIPAATTLVEALRAAPDAAARRALAASAGRAVGVLHEAGVWHADLNLTNILVHPVPGGSDVVLLDFDRARVVAGPLGPRARLRNLRRLARSLAKLDQARELAGPDETRAFRTAYAAAAASGGVPCAS
jgi:3-deoxy-D-manno-octulosonic acid kinase